MKKNLIIITGFILIMLTIILIAIKPKIYLNGEDIVTLNLNEEYKEQGASSYILYKNVSNKIKIKNNINNQKIGSYYVTYEIKYLNRTFSIKRKVEVVDTEKPVITLKGSTNLKLCPNTKYEEEGYSAIDNYDGNLTSSVLKFYTDDKIIYRVYDSSNNMGRNYRNVKYIDEEAPKITLNGGDLVLALNSEYNEPGYNVSDNCDNNLDVSISGKVDTSKVGTYDIVYSTKDTSGNITKVTRKVEVVEKINTDKVIFLTFDDGPSSTITPNILQILKEENVKATFFVINHNDNLNYLIKEESDLGHTVALHSYTHNYRYIYASEENYFSDLDNIKNKVKDITGKEANIIRFPGGSSNTVSKFNPGIMTYLSKEVANRGYVYFDWNVESSDAGGARTKEDVYTNVVSHLNDKINVVLMHDYENNYKTLDALRDIIKYGKEHGYTFDKITTNTKQIKHGIAN